MAVLLRQGILATISPVGFNVAQCSKRPRTGRVLSSRDCGWFDLVPRPDRSTRVPADLAAVGAFKSVLAVVQALARLVRPSTSIETVCDASRHASTLPFLLHLDII
jgi:hypothetical protein